MKNLSKQYWKKPTVRCMQSMNATETAHAITMKSQDLREKSDLSVQ